MFATLQSCISIGYLRGIPVTVPQNLVGILRMMCVTANPHLYLVRIIGALPFLLAQAPVVPDWLIRQDVPIPLARRDAYRHLLLALEHL
jgi:hypothetical protein